MSDMSGVVQANIVVIYCVILLSELYLRDAKIKFILTLSALKPARISSRVQEWDSTFKTQRRLVKWTLLPTAGVTLAWALAGIMYVPYILMAIHVAIWVMVVAYVVSTFKALKKMMPNG